MYYFYSISSFSQLLAALYLFYFITFSANNLIVFYLILILINLFAKVAEGCVRRKCTDGIPTNATICYYIHFRFFKLFTIYFDRYNTI